MYEYFGVVTRVVDGDTLEIKVDLGFKVSMVEKFRLLGVDTPETYGVKKTSEEYKAGIRAKRFVEQMLGLTNMEVIVQTKKDKKGKYGRWLATIHPASNGTGTPPWSAPTLNETLIVEGLAVEKDY